MQSRETRPPTATGNSTWIVFTIFGVLLTAYGAYAFLLPSVQPSHWDDLTSNPEVVAYIAGNFRWLGLLSCGFGILTVWYLNLVAEPRASIEVGRTRYDVIAEEARNQQRDRIWQAVPQYWRDYQAHYSIPLPVMVLRQSP